MITACKIRYLSPILRNSIYLLKYPLIYSTQLFLIIIYQILTSLCTASNGVTFGLAE